MADDYKDLISEGDDFDGTIVMADEEGNEISFTSLIYWIMRARAMFCCCRRRKSLPMKW